MNSTFSGC